MNYWWVGLLLLMVMMAVSYWRRKSTFAAQAELEAVKQNAMRAEDNYNTIFIAIPCYRDESECAQTLFSIFNEAECPWRVRVGILHHVEPVNDYSDNILNLYEQLCDRHHATSFQKQIRVVMAASQEAKGPLSARAFIEANMFKNERFYMTMDSHMRMVAGWDTKVLSMYESCLALSERPILTTFPANFNRQTQQPEDDRPTYVAADGFDQDGFPRPKALPFVTMPVRPVESLFWVPCFSFASSRIINDVPLLDTLPYLFFPEMYFQSARYWTHGWDFFAPTDTLAYHVADRTYRPTFWEQLQSKDALVVRMRSLKTLQDNIRVDTCRVCLQPREQHTGNHTFEAAAALVWFGRHRALLDYNIYSGLQNVGDPTDANMEEFTRMGCTRDMSDAEQIAKFGKVVQIINK